MRLLFLLSFVWLMVAPVARAFDFSRPIQVAPSTTEEFLALRFDSSIYAHSRDGFPDVRLIDSNGVETAYWIDKLRFVREERVRKVRATKILSLEAIDNRAIEIQLHLKDEDPAVEGLIVHTPLSDFEHRVRVLGSVDGKNWRSLVENALIFDYSRFVDLNNSEIALPSNDFRWFKLRIEEPVQAYESQDLELTREIQQGQEQSRQETTQIRRLPLRIDGVDYWYKELESKEVSDTIVDVPIGFMQTREDPDNLTTSIEITTRREPLSAFIIQSKTRNFNRRVSIEIPEPRPGDADHTRAIASGTLERLSFRALQRESLRIEFPEQRQSRYRIVIQNDNSPPVEISAVQAQGPVYRLMFFTEIGKEYRLLYGDPEAKAPLYDIASLRLALADSYEPEQVALGLESATAEPGSKQRFEFTRWLNSDLFLGAVIVFVVVVLAVALVYAAKRIDSGSRE